MRSLVDVWREPLFWVQAGVFSREYHLVLGDERLATLRFAGFTGREANAESAEGHWILRRDGRLSRSVTILDAAGDRAIARFEGHWFGRGRLTFEGGESVDWRSLGFWGLEWGFAREGGDPVVRIRNRFSFLRDKAGVTIERDSQPARELAVMAILGWYLLVRMKRRAAAAA
jgi:hypothetical protein